MFNVKNFTRLFFLLALATSIGAGVRYGSAQSGGDLGNCADGNRKLCLTQPMPGGGTSYFYWV